MGLYLAHSKGAHYHQKVLRQIQVFSIINSQNIIEFHHVDELTTSMWCSNVKSFISKLNVKYLTACTFVL